MLRKTWRIAWKSLLYFTVFVALYFFMAWLLSRITVNNDFKAQRSGVKIFVRTNGVHCDIIVPSRDGAVNWFGKIPVQDCERADTTFAYVAFGWGDKGFYLETPQWSDLKFTTAFRALFFLSSTAVHVTWWKYGPEEDGNCKPLTITEEQYARLTAYICKSFRTDDRGCCSCIAHKGYTSCDRFYEANGTYSLFKTCNVWAGRALMNAGVKVGCWTPFDWCLMESLQ